jgi:arylsulfatase A-like enzyme
LLALASLWVCCRPPQAPEKRPGAASQSRNVLLITMDTTRADRLGVYGATTGLTPHLDALAAEGVLFHEAIAQAAVTPVSHASILTGRYPYAHGLRRLHGTKERRLAEEETTLAERLSALGFETAAVISAFPAGSFFGLAQGFATFDESFVDDTEPISDQGVVNTHENQRGAGETTDRALAWLAGARAPFFLWVHYFDPHDPNLLPPDVFLSRFRRPEGDERAQLRAVYDIEVAYMDQQIGRLLDALAQQGKRQETIVAALADHGEGLGDHDWWTHGVLYQEQIRVPFLIAGPGVPSGRVIEARVRTVDLVPTLLELLGAPAPRAGAMDGESLLPLFSNPGEAEPRDAYAEALGRVTYRFTKTISDHKKSSSLAFLSGRWKYVHHLGSDRTGELFDLEVDPAELADLSTAKAAEAAALLRRLRRIIASVDAIAEPGATDDETARRLRALGYIE